MANLIRRADIEKDRALITEFLSGYLSPAADDDRYEWLYCKNPGGLAQAWLAYEPETRQVIGVAAAFPRQMRCDGTEVLGHVLGDFCIHPDYRSLGPALALQRQCLEDLTDNDAGPIFDFPSASMLAIYRRLRIETPDTMIRFAKPLRADRLVNRLIPGKIAARGVSAVANLGLRLRDFSSRHKSAWKIAEECIPCGEEFTMASRQWSRRTGICVARTAEYLTWRYVLHPQRRYHLCTARKDGRLCGFLVYDLAGEDAVIVDLLTEEEAVMTALLGETAETVREKGVNTLSAPFLSSHPGRELLENCGFRARETSPVVLLSLRDASKRRENGTKKQWYLTHGDRES
jgi:GNAT superfamily N-acetyltransferase